MMTIKDFNIGDKVYVLDFGYRSNFENAVLKEATVTDIGRKLVTLIQYYKNIQNIITLLTFLTKCISSFN